MSKTNVIQLADYLSDHKMDLVENRGPLNVLVTRPEPKGKFLAADLQAAGIRAQHCALFRYQSVENTFLCKSLLTFDDDATLIFVSVAAVDYANKILPCSSWCYRQVFAVGQATQDKLTSLGIKAISPEQQDSEGLLQIKALHTIKGDNVIIVRGDSGRELIFNTLLARGAKVIYAQSYVRFWQPPQMQSFTEWQQQKVNCIVTTSVAILENMLDLLLADKNLSTENYWKKSCYWLVASERIALRAKMLGLTKVINTQSADNQRLLAVIMELEQNNDR